MSKHSATQQLEVSEIKRRSLSGAASYFGRTIFLQIIGLLSAFALSYYFSPEDFGVYGFVIQIIGILTFFSDVGLAAALIQKKEEPSTLDYRTAFGVQQLLSWAIVLVAALLAQLAVVESKIGAEGQWVLYALAVSFPLATIKTIPSIILERKLQFSKLVLPQIFEQIVFHGVLIYMAITGVGVLAYAWAIILRSIVGVVVMTIIQPWSFGIALNMESLRSLIGFGIKFQLNDLLARIKDQLFYLFLGFVLPIREFGYVQWAKNWSMYPYNLTVQNVLAITFPTFSRLQHDKAILQKAIEKSLFFISLALFPLIVGMSIFIFPFIQLVPAWEKWLPAAPLLVLFCISIAWGGISTPLTNALNAIGQINTTLKLMILWTVLTWVLTPLLLIPFGFIGVGAAAVIISCTSVLSVYYIQKVVPIGFIKQVYIQFFASLGMAVVGFIGIQQWSISFSHFVLGIICTGATYLVLVFVIGRTKVLSEIRSLLQ